MPIPRLAQAAFLLTLLWTVPADAALFAKKATAVADIHGSIRPMTLTAPDGRTRAVARFSDFSSADSTDGKLTVFLGRNGFDFAGGPKAELLWAPDSHALAVVADGSDTDGHFRTSIIVRKKVRGWRRIDLTDRVTQLFAPHMRCGDRQEPDIGAIGWTSGKRLIVAAQVPKHSGCAGSGSFTAYIVDVPTGEVLMEMDQRAIRQHYHRMLGTLLSPSASRHGHDRHRKR